EHELPPDAAARFWVLGGESNYLLACAAVTDERGESSYVLQPKPELWKPLWSPDEASPSPHSHHRLARYHRTP
ncbi:MAG: hypothetical protein SGPRY_009828, partial [Prymnesium sp.]